MPPPPMLGSGAKETGKGLMLFIWAPEQPEGASTCCSVTFIQGLSILCPCLSGGGTDGAPPPSPQEPQSLFDETTGFDHREWSCLPSIHPPNHQTPLTGKMQCKHADGSKMKENVVSVGLFKEKGACRPKPKGEWACISEQSLLPSTTCTHRSDQNQPHTGGESFELKYVGA